MIKRWSFRVYNGLVLLVLPLIAVYVLVRWRRRVFKNGSDRWAERRGILSDELRKRLAATGPWWWVHAVSIGEVKAIESFLRRAPGHASAHVLLSVVTPEAIAWAEERKVAEVVIAAPIDLPWMVRRVFRAVRPALFISVESEFWPNLLREARRSGAKVALINGRLSERSFRSYRRLRSLVAALWDCFDLWAVRQAQDAERFIALGAPKEKVKVSGNLKYDMPVQVHGRRPNAPAGLVIVVGSSREGEESKLLPVIDRLRGRWPDLGVIWAPRHVERTAEVAALLSNGGRSIRRKSETAPGLTLFNGAKDVIWDSMGDLLDAYQQADVAVVGGSFVEKGGQNPLEPAALRVPVIFGPSMDNFHGIAEILVHHGGAKQVPLEGLEGALAELLAEPEKRRLMGERARDAMEDHQGATEKTLQLLEALQRG